MSASFGYDSLGRRRSKTIGSTTTNFLYDARNVVQELNSGGNATLLTGLTSDAIFARTDASGMSTFLRDGVGSVIELADASSSLATHYTFEPFGMTRRSGASSENAQQFTARENDSTGLYFYRARYYSPSLQRFISEDPLEYGGGTNLFGYVGDGPTRYVDPLGLKRKDPDDDPCKGDVDEWFRDPSHPYKLGRRGTPIPEGGLVGRLLEDYVPGSHAAATGHDGLVDWLTEDLGWPDWLANIPTMPGTYLAELLNQLARSAGHPLWEKCHQ